MTKIKFLEKDLGVFDYSKFYRVDFSESNETELLSTMIHESVHLSLTYSTLYGFVNSSIDQLTLKVKNNPINIQKISNILIECSTKTHESVATFQEYLFRKFLDQEQYKKSLKDLRSLNHKYFNYIKDLLPLFDRDDWEDLKTSNIIRRLGELALSVDLSLLPIDVTNHAELEKLMRDNRYASQFRPDTRFKILKKSLFSLLSDYKLDSISNEMLINASSIKVDNQNVEEILRLIKWLKNQFKAPEIETYFDKIKNDFETSNFISMSEFNIIDFAQPTLLNKQFELKDSDIHQLIEKIPEDHAIFGALFIVPIDESELLFIFSDIQNGINYKVSNSAPEVFSFIEGMMIPVIIPTHEYYEKIKSNRELFDLITSTSQFFVFIDIPYSFSKNEVISNLISLNKEVMAFQANSSFYSVFIDMHDENGIMIQFIFKHAMQQFLDDVKSGHYHYVNDNTSNCFFNEKDIFYYNDSICALMQKKLHQIHKEGEIVRIRYIPD